MARPTDQTMGMITDFPASLASTLRAARSRVLSVVDAAGTNRLISRTAWRRRRLLILCYHGISLHDEHQWSDLYISPEHFARRLELLKRMGATVLPLDEALERLYRDDLPEQAVALTFDDGAYDFSARAEPILQAADMHATLYLTTYYCGRAQPVFDTAVSYLLWTARGRTIKLPRTNLTITVEPSTATPGFAKQCTAVRRYALENSFCADEKHAYARQLAEAVGYDFDAMLARRMLQLMSRAEVAALDEKHVALQLHTHRHRTPRDRELFLRELRDNAKEIRALRPSAEPFTHFCYPSGDYVREYADWLKTYGVRWATTCDPGLASRASDPYFLPRFIDTQYLSESVFRAWVAGSSLFFFARRTTAPVRLSP